MVVNIDEVKDEWPIEMAAAIANLHGEKIREFCYVQYDADNGFAVLHTVTGHDNEDIIHVCEDGTVNVTKSYKDAIDYRRQG